MKNIFNDLRNLFEKKSTNNAVNAKKGTSDIDGIVKERMQYFENLQTTNADSTGSGKRKLLSMKSFKDTSNNMDETPDMVMNHERLCIYNDDDDGLYGSFKRRPKFVRQNSVTEKEVIMRLKSRESVHGQISRYESILKVPLSQEVIASKYRSEMRNSRLASNERPTKDVSLLIEKCTQEDLSSDEKENIIDMAVLESIRNSNIRSSSHVRPTKMLELIKDNRFLSWKQTERVRSRNLVSKLSEEEILFQESQFELISSEASYYRSLNVLVDKFYHSPLLSIKNKDNKDGLKAYQKEHLFSNILQIHSISGKFLSELEQRFSKSVEMKDVCDIVTKFANGDFKVYIPYIQNQKFQTEIYNELKKDVMLSKVIEDLEKQPECCSLNMDSFLFLPLQRLLKIQLLVKTIKKNIPKGYSSPNRSVDIAIAAMDNIISTCNANVVRMEERQRNLEISRSLMFKFNQTRITISSGTLLHEGEAKCYFRSAKNSSAIGKIPYDAWLILTNQYFLITKIVRNKELKYYVQDSCKVSQISLQTSLDCNINEICLTFNKFTYVLKIKSKDDYDKWMSELSKCLNPSL